MSLPHEAEVIEGIATQYRAELDAMAGLHYAVVGMMWVASWTISKQRGLDEIVIKTMMALLTSLQNISNQYRSCVSAG
jgi:hypothetical protein